MVKKKAYEAGSRYVFLFLNLVNEKKMNEEFLENKEFLYHMLHGLCNSLGLTYEVESQIHYALYYDIMKRYFLSKKLNIDVKAYVDKVNKGRPELFYQRLINLAEKLCEEKLSKEFPGTDAEGKILPIPFENLVWGSVLIASAWLGWIFNPKQSGTTASHIQRKNSSFETLLFQAL